jgi:hypothetical protein
MGTTAVSRICIEVGENTILFVKNISLVHTDFNLYIVLRNLPNSYDKRK